MSAHHGEHAWTLRYKDPICPYAVAFLYAEQGASVPPRYLLRVATRIVRDGPEVADAPQLLYQLCEVARSFREQGRLDPRTQMADQCEPMAPTAVYIGVAVSTLDTPSGVWAHVRKTATGPLTIPGRALALLSDATMLVVDRRTDILGAPTHIASTHSLDIVPGHAVRMWQWTPALANLTDPATREVWHWMTQLHALIAQSQHHH
jgi:hypothetical protein